MKLTLRGFYNAEFYENNIEGMTSSAQEVLALLYKFYQPKSVVDVGCGQGAWLAVAESLGSNELLGVDGSWVNPDRLLSKNMTFLPVNFETAMPEIKGKYDLCISLEVAEHISEERAERFIEVLCNASDAVLFGAAIEAQGGARHINEQWQSYWIDIFKAHDYECFDVIRPSLWNDESVAWWYRQNTFLFLKKGSLTMDRGLLKTAERPIFNVAHPENYQSKSQWMQHPTLKSCVGYAKRYVAIKLRGLLGIAS
jgi:SAM-dependent methyltransferase